jgi:glutamate---cysteine ligase / carboxylate-amine ligase
VRDEAGHKGDSFGRAAPWTLGVEEELFFVDAGTLDARSGFSLVVGEPDERVKPEVFESLVELTTPVLPDGAAVLDWLSAMRAEVDQAAAEQGLRVYAAGSHPLARGTEQAVVPLPRYEQLFSSVGDAMWQQLVCGLHVHVSIPDDKTALRAYEAVVPWLPTLLALSANSPFVEGGDTGRRSERAERLLLLPTGGTPPVLGTWDHWYAASGRDSTRRHWDAWPRPQYGTLEVRVMDMQTDVRRSAGFAAIVRALVLTAPGTVEQPYDRASYARRREDATRLPPDSAEVETLAARIDPVLEGDDRVLARLVLEGRPEAERQLEVAAADGIAAVPRDVLERTLG